MIRGSYQCRVFQAATEQVRLLCHSLQRRTSSHWYSYYTSATRRSKSPSSSIKTRCYLLRTCLLRLLRPVSPTLSVRVPLGESRSRLISGLFTCYSEAPSGAFASHPPERLRRLPLWRRVPDRGNDLSKRLRSQGNSPRRVPLPFGRYVANQTHCRPPQLTRNSFSLL
jgi:hypothetical protein